MAELQKAGENVVNKRPDDTALSPVPVFETGSTVFITGLAKKANGKAATVRRFEPNSSQYELQVEGERQTHLIKPENIRLGYEEELLEIFRMIDDDGNGVMDFSELLDLGKGVNASFTAKNCHKLLGRMDDNDDGQVTQLEFIDFIGKMMKGHSQASNDKGIAQVRRSAEVCAKKKQAARRSRTEEEAASLRKQLHNLKAEV